MAQPIAADKASETINDRYRVVRELGQGGMGKVYLVEDGDRGGQLMALKTLLPQTTDHLLTSGFRDEFGELAKVRHQNLAAAYDFGKVSRTRECFFTTEFINGVDLLEATKDFTTDQLVDVTGQLLKGLEFIHNLGLLHNDLKPANILVERGAGARGATEERGDLHKLESLVFGHSGRVKIIDFGLICREHTVTNKILGTLRYISPERILRVAADRRSDLYSLGIVLYVVFTRFFPFDNKDVHKLLEMHIKQPAPPITSVRSDLPLFLAQLVHRLLEKRPEDRFSGAAEALDFLAREAGSGSGPARKSRAPTTLEAGALLHRGKELNTLVEAYELAKSGAAQDHCILVQGPAGAGKSRLVEELRGHVQLSGGVFVTTSGAAVESTLQPVLDAVLAGLKTSGFEDVENVKTDIAVGCQNGAKSLAHVLERWLLIYSETVPVLLHIDDFDRASDAVYRFVIDLVHAASTRTRREDPHSRILVILSRRVSEAGDRWRISGVPTLQIGNFSPQQSVEFICHVFGQEDIPKPVLDAIVRLSRGNPLFLLGLVNHLAERGELTFSGTRWEFPRTLEGIALPASLGHLFEDKLKTLSNRALELLYWIAIAGEPIPDVLLRRCMDARAADQDEVSDSLVQRNLIVAVNDDQGGRSIVYDFAHAGSREALLSRLGKDEARELYRQLAQHAEELLADSPGRAEMLARLWLASGNEAGFLRFGEQAADVLRQRGDLPGAVAYCQRLVRATPDSATAKKIQSLARLSEMHEVLWELDACRIDLLEIERLGANLMKPLDRGMLLRRLGCVEIARQRNERAAELLGQSLALVSPSGSPALRAAIEAPLAWALWFSGRKEAAVEHVAIAAGLASTGLNAASSGPGDARDRMLLVATASYLAQLSHQRGEIEQATALYRRNLQLLHGLGQAQAESATRCCLGSVLADAGEFDLAAQELLAAQEIGKETGDRRVLCRARERLGDCHLRLGNLRAALQVAQVGLEDAESMRNATALSNSLQTLGRIYVAADQSADARAVLTRAVGLQDGATEIVSRELGRACLLRFLLDEGENASAGEILGALVENAAGSGLPLLCAHAAFWSFVHGWKTAQRFDEHRGDEAIGLLTRHGYRGPLLDFLLADVDVSIEARQFPRARRLLDEFLRIAPAAHSDALLAATYYRASLHYFVDREAGKAFLMLKECRDTAFNRSQRRLARRCVDLMESIQKVHQSAKRS